MQMKIVYFIFCTFLIFSQAKLSSSKTRLASHLKSYKPDAHSLNEQETCLCGKDNSNILGKCPCSAEIQKDAESSIIRSSLLKQPNTYNTFFKKTQDNVVLFDVKKESKGLKTKDLKFADLPSDGAPKADALDSLGRSGTGKDIAALSNEKAISGPPVISTGSVSKSLASDGAPKADALDSLGSSGTDKDIVALSSKKAMSGPPVISMGSVINPNQQAEASEDST